MEKRTGTAGILAITNVVLLSFFLCCTAGAKQQPTQEPSTPVVRAENQGILHDLGSDEEQGGHTLQRHVGRTDGQLRERLERERYISAASTYSDRQVAEETVGEALNQSKARIDRWLARSEGHPNLVLDYHTDHPIGRVLNRGESQPVPCSNAIVVLKWGGRGHYYILTSYPECR